MIQKIAPGVFLINLYDPIQLAPLYRDMRELSTLGFWAPRSQRPFQTGPNTALRTRARGSAARNPGVELFFVTSTSRHIND